MVRRTLRSAPWLSLAVLLWASSLLPAQVRTGELRVRVEDPAGLAVRAQVELASGANQLRLTLAANDAGLVDFSTLPYGFYTLTVRSPGFAPVLRQVEVRSALVAEQRVHLAVAAAITTVEVNEQASLLDPYRPSSVSQIGRRQVEDRVTSLPGRSVEDLVNSQPGWLYEGNAVLHPRGSEYQTQYVVDGVPLTENRSPSFGPELEADDVDSLSVYTAGFPAEYGRKLGGVIELNTRNEPRAGLHGELELAGGSYATAQSFAQMADNIGRNSFALTASASRSSHYLNPVVPENFSNNGTTGDFSARYGRQLRQPTTFRLSCVTSFRASTFPTSWCSSKPGSDRPATTLRPSAR